MLPRLVSITARPVLGLHERAIRLSRVMPAFATRISISPSAASRPPPAASRPRVGDVGLRARRPCRRPPGWPRPPRGLVLLGPVVHATARPPRRARGRSRVRCRATPRRRGPRGRRAQALATSCPGLRDVLRRADRDRGQPAVDALDEAGQDVARADLDERDHAAGPQRLDGLAELHRRRELADEDRRDALGRLEPAGDGRQERGRRARRSGRRRAPGAGAWRPSP